MSTGEKKGITVKIDADLHNQIREYLDAHEMTMAEFITLAADNELHPKYYSKEGNNMANTRTIAFQVPEDLFQRIKDYLQRNNMTQRQFLIGLIEEELMREELGNAMDSEPAPDLDEDQPDEEADVAESSVSEEEDQSFAMSM